MLRDMPRHTRTFLLLTLVLVIMEALLVTQEALAGGSNHLLLYVLVPLGFVATGLGALVYAARQEEPEERDVVRGSTVVPFGCFVMSGAIALWVAMLDYVHR
jgi:predicted membrane channel-forming protein YqfA (hemolysin III family)